MVGRDSRNRRRNRGFSLVELIFAISIMAVMVGFIAPQFIKYTRRSKRAVDVANAEQIVKAFNASRSEEDAGSITDGNPSTFATNAREISWTQSSLASGAPYGDNSAYFYVLNSCGDIPDPKSVDYSWYLVFDDTTTAPIYVYIVDGAGSGTSWELWPDPTNFMDNGP